MVARLSPDFGRNNLGIGPISHPFSNTKAPDLALEGLFFLTAIFRARKWPLRIDEMAIAFIGVCNCLYQP